MVNRNELIAYALDFSSYLISKEEEINQIILYGSVARGDFDEKSDIDLFIDISKKKEGEINKILDNYYQTKKYGEWRLKGIKNPISLIIGELDSVEWKNLKRSIINTGIILYGKYKSSADKTNFYILFSFENIKPDKKRISIYRKIFGFKRGKVQYSGLVDNIKAIRVGKGSILVPIEGAERFKKYFQEKRVGVKMYDLWSDVKF
jgi:predicted nucleotidyltransferase